ncbi:MAG: hypothetical protein RRC07_07145 [Anaerolineae bacterium]|nr:hypothetical protein [Anaerolineae bacterium]
MNAQETRDFLQRYVAAIAADFDAGIEQYVADESLKEHGHHIVINEGELLRQLDAFPAPTSA